MLVAAADANIQPPAGQSIDQGYLRYHPRRRMQGQDQDGAADPDIFGHCRRLVAHEQWRRAQAIVREVVLRKPSATEAELFRQARMFQRFR